MQSYPILPKLILMSVAVKKLGQLENVVNDPIAPDDSSYDMQCKVAEMIDGTERGEANALESSVLPSAPEGLDFRHFDEQGAFVPKAKMQLDRRRHIGVIRITLPFPTPQSRERGKVIGSQKIVIVHGRVTDGLERSLGLCNLADRAEDVEVALHPETRMFDIVWGLRESLHNKMRNT